MYFNRYFPLTPGTGRLLMERQAAASGFVESAPRANARRLMGLWVRP